MKDLSSQCCKHVIFGLPVILYFLAVLLQPFQLSGFVGEGQLHCGTWGGTWARQLSYSHRMQLINRDTKHRPHNTGEPTNYMEEDPRLEAAVIRPGGVAQVVALVRGHYRVNTQAPVSQHGDPLLFHRRGHVSSGDFLSVFHPYRQNWRHAAASATTRK